MSDANFKIVEPQERLTRAYNGIYYGPLSLILARTPERLLIWTPGHSAWSGTGQPWVYQTAEMFVVARTSSDYVRLAKGGRLEAAIRAMAAGIDKHFGDGFHQLLERGKTVVVGDSEPVPVSGWEPRR